MTRARAAALTVAAALLAGVGAAAGQRRSPLPPPLHAPPGADPGSCCALDKRSCAEAGCLWLQAEAECRAPPGDEPCGGSGEPGEPPPRCDARLPHPDRTLRRTAGTHWDRCARQPARAAGDAPQRRA